jgi:hypothetical protein
VQLVFPFHWFRYLMYDNIHLNETGHAVLGALISQELVYHTRLAAIDIEQRQQAQRLASGLSPSSHSPRTDVRSLNPSQRGALFYTESLPSLLKRLGGADPDLSEFAASLTARL